MNTNPRSIPIKATIQTAWSKVYGTKWSFNIATSITFLVAAVMFTAIQIFKQADYQWAVIAVRIIKEIFGLLLNTGIMYLGLKRARGLEISYKQMWAAFKPRIALSLIVFHIILFVIFFLLFLLFVIAYALKDSGIPAASLVTVVLIALASVLAIFFATRLSLTPLLILDTEINPLDAIRVSYNATADHVIELVLLYLFASLITFISAIPLGIGLIWTIPFILILGGEIYQLLIPNKQ